MHAAKSSSWLPPVAIQDLVVLLFLGFLISNSLASLADAMSTGWQLKTGMWILRHGAVPQVDPFLALPGPRLWFADQWLGSLILASLYHLGSWPLLYAFSIAVIAVGYLGFLYHGVAALTGQRLLTSIALVAALQTGMMYFSLQPLLLSPLFFTILYIEISRWLWATEEKKARDRGLLFTLPLLFVLWANVHPHFIIGLLLVFVLVAVSQLEPALRVHAKRLARMAILCLFATLLNPYGLGLLAQAAARANFVGGLSSPQAGWALQIGIAVLFLGATAFKGERALLSRFEVAALLIFGCLSLNFPFLAPYFAIVATIPVVRSLHAMIDAADTAKVLPTLYTALSRLEQREKKSLSGLPLLTALLSILFFSASVNHRLPMYSGPFGPEAKLFPYGALEVLRDTTLEESSLVIAAPVQWGGFLTLVGDDFARPLVDDRIAVVGRDVYKEFAEALQVGGKWKEFILKYGVTHLLLSRNEPLAAALKTSGEMLVLYEDSLSILFDARSAS